MLQTTTNVQISHILCVHCIRNNSETRSGLSGPTNYHIRAHSHKSIVYQLEKWFLLYDNAPAHHHRLSHNFLQENRSEWLTIYPTHQNVLQLTTSFSFLGWMWHRRAVFLTIYRQFRRMWCFKHNFKGGLGVCLPIVVWAI